MSNGLGSHLLGQMHLLRECRADDRRAGYIILRHIVIFKKLPNEAGEAEDKYKVSVNSNHNTNTNTK